jgi:hypothetical protein
VDTAGNRRFSGARMVPGADVWLHSQTSGALILMGVWCGTARPTPKARKQGCVYGHTSRVECVEQSATETKLANVVQGDVLPLDKSLLMGV